MKSSFLLFLVLSAFFGCGGKDKIELSLISIDRDINIKNSPSQNYDSIEVFNTNRLIKSTGDSVFNITTKENRRSNENSDKNKTADTLNPEMTHYSYSLNEAADFIVTIFDNNGNKLLNLVEGRFSKGIYEVYVAIYSVLKPGTYISGVSHQNSDQYFKIIVK